MIAVCGDGREVEVEVLIHNYLASRVELEHEQSPKTL